ncbi:MAG: hypothetical protein ACYDCO_27950 [Armatimonadota bacterium]
METTQRETVLRPRAGRRARLAWGLLIVAYVLLSVVLFDSVQLYLRHRMTTGHLLWSFADARGWYGLANSAQGYTVIIYLLTLLLIIATLVVIDEDGWRTGKLGTGIGICFILFLAGMITPGLNGSSYPTITTCVDTQRQLILAAQMHAQDHDGRLPNDWSIFEDYLGWTNNGHYLCPVTLEPFHKPGGYGLNGQIAGKKEREITDPKVFLIADSIQPEMILQSNSDIATRRHRVDNGRGFAVSYLDGTTKFLPENVTLKWK